ncbi:SLC13 family permease [Falsiroseomonas tokyonensis]|uniref:SLC13 family permease n=1 Tax=Falsiroseomonas tokyonensis TaxID=430521 RepID=A0ABV7BWG4_9PROT|nr:SLC13 family permease [Falsiroseomonas tokyonensis]MBU8540011.1 SLC13 family permease [Falsiroseomonas tokyonensis]
MSDIALMAAIILAAIILFVWNRIPVIIVAMGVGLALYATGLVTLNQALSGFGDPAVMFIATLFVISAALDRTGVTAWAGQMLIRGAGEESRTRLLVLIALLVALLTALISVNGAVAALLPVVMVMALRLRRNPSQLLMPLVFSAHAGSMLALTGTPVNVLVSEAAADAGMRAIGFFEFTIIGIPLLLGTIAITVLFGERLLPHRAGETMSVDFGRHATTLVEQYGLQKGLFRLRLRTTSPLVGQPPTALDAPSWQGLRLVAIHDGESGERLQRETLAEGDFLLVSGDGEEAARLAASHHLAFWLENSDVELRDSLFNRSSGLAEVMIPPRSEMIGQTAFQGMVTESGDLVVIAIQRGGVDAGVEPVTLQAGDTMLLQGSWKALDVRLADPQVLVVNSPELVRRQAVPLGIGAWGAIGVLAAMVFFLATGLLPAAVAGILGIFALVLMRILTVEQCYRVIDWTTVILVAAMMPLSTAMVQTGAAEMMADGLVAMAAGGSPTILLAGLFILTAVLGQLISNTATALIIIPVGVAAASAMDVSPLPVLMTIAVAAAAAFLTPIATPTNLMVMRPGGYAFGEYWKFGLPMMIWFFIVGVFIVPLVWRF